MRRVGYLPLWTVMIFVVSFTIANAATVEVNGVNNPPTTFATVKDAVDYLNTNHADELNNTVNVTTDGPLFETGLIAIGDDQEGGFTLNGDADGNATPCTLITDASTSGSQGNFEMPFTSNYAQIWIGGASAEYTIQDLIIQPIFRGPNMVLDDTDKADGVRGIVISTEGLAGFTINLINVTIGGSKAGNVLAADPDVNEWALCTRYHRNNTWSGGYANTETGNNLVRMTNLRVFNIHNEGWIHDTEYGDLDINEGCVFAWCGEDCLDIRSNVDSILTMDGTPDSRILVRGSGQDGPDTNGGLIVTGPDSDTQAFTWLTMTYVDCIENGGANEMGRFVGPVYMDNCFIALNDQSNDDATGGGTGLRYGYVGASGVVGASTSRTIQNCTIYDSQNPAGVQRGINFVTPGMNGFDFNLGNVIIAGSSDDGVHMEAGSDSIMGITDCAVVTAGPDALDAQFTGAWVGPGGSGTASDFTLSLSNVTTADPQFSSTTYTYGDVSEFLRVTNGAYTTAGPGGGQLTGAGGLIGPTPTPTETPVVSGMDDVKWRDYR